MDTEAISTQIVMIDMPIVTNIVFSNIDDIRVSNYFSTNITYLGSPAWILEGRVQVLEGRLKNLEDSHLVTWVDFAVLFGVLLIAVLSIGMLLRWADKHDENP